MTTTLAQAVAITDPQDQMVAVLAGTEILTVLQDGIPKQTTTEAIAALSASVVPGELASPNGASLVGFEQLGTGAVLRTVQSKLQEAVSVLDFGADPTGTINSTSAIQVALNTGKDVFLPDGVYAISTPLTVSVQGQKFFGGPLATLLKTVATQDAIDVTGNYCVVEGFSINGNSAAGTGGSGIGVFSQYVHISKINTYANGGHGIYIDGEASLGHDAAFVVVSGCISHDNGGVGIASNTAPDCVRTDNVVYNNQLEGITDDLPSYRNIISNNKVFNNCLTGGVGGIGVDTASDSIITNNQISATQSDLPGIKFQNNIGATNFCTVSGNNLTNNTGGGIWLHYGTGGGCFSNVMAANTFQGNTGFDIKIDAGCTNNTLSGIMAPAIIVDSNAGGVNPKAGYVCSFRAYNNATLTDVTGDGTMYTVPLNATSYLNGSVFNIGTGVFMAPVTGIYQFNAACRLQAGLGQTFAQIHLVQMGSVSQTSQGELDLAATTYNLSIADQFAMQAGDTLTLQVAAYGGTKVMTIPASPIQTFLSGTLIG